MATKKQGIRKKVKFYNWAVKQGLDLKNFEPENLNFDPPIKPKSSFKKRSQFIKETYNYVFRMREQNFIGTFLNIETLTFVKK